ncbi:hypothetical protein MTO96_012585 [Rhipicephalus appendiculatus]
MDDPAVVTGPLQLCMVSCGDQACFVRCMVTTPRTSPPDTTPSVLALQEPLCPVKLRDYTAFHPSSEAHPYVATLVHRNLTAVLHQLDVSDCAHLLLEILPRRRTEASLFVLNVYSPPKAPSAPLLLVLRKALSCAGHNAVVILGDFNAPHTSWGYPQNTRKGHSLWNFIHNERLSILNDFTRPTRIGSSVQRDTNPDLALARNVADSSWCNTGISLGSDHYVLCTTFPLPLPCSLFYSSCPGSGLGPLPLHSSLYFLFFSYHGPLCLD